MERTEPAGLANLCFSCLMDGGTETSLIMPAEAAEMLASWKAESPELLEDVDPFTAEDLFRVWNETVKTLHRGGTEA